MRTNQKSFFKLKSAQQNRQYRVESDNAVYLFVYLAPAQCGGRVQPAFDRVCAARITDSGA